MKRIGLIGGLSWESTINYYRIINERVGDVLGGRHGAELILYSLDFAQARNYFDEERFEDAVTLLALAGSHVVAAGADFAVLCSNAAHLVADELEARMRIPLLHIADATGCALVNAKTLHVGLVGTRETMGCDFYRQRLHSRWGVQVDIPEGADFDLVHEIALQDVADMGKRETASHELLACMRRLVAAGADGVVLGCTEFSLLVTQAAADFPIYDTTALHARAAADVALGTHGSLQFFLNERSQA